MNVRLFLDTEWADEPGRQLVPLALVAETGEEFYAERAELPERPTRFAEEVVYPLLERGDAALDDFAFATRLRTFVGHFDKPTIVYDFSVDPALLVTVLNGFDRFKGRALDAVTPMPIYTTWYLGAAEARAPKLIAIDPGLAWFAANPTAIQHHTLHDARALRYACLSTDAGGEPVTGSS